MAAHDTEPATLSGNREPPMRPVQRGFERLLTLSRLLVLIPVVFLLLDAAGSFIYGTDILVRTATGVFGEPAHVGGRLGLFQIVMDTFLVGATLMIAAFGFYELLYSKAMTKLISSGCPAGSRCATLKTSPATTPATSPNRTTWPSHKKGWPTCQPVAGRLNR